MSSRKDMLAAIVTLLLTIGILIVSFAPDGSGYEFPQTVSVIMVIIAASFALLTIIPKKQVIADGGDSMRWGSVWPVLLVLSAFLLIVEWLGFFATSFIAFYSIVMVYSPERLCRRTVIRNGVISAIFMGVLYIVFVPVLNVQIPSGILI